MARELSDWDTELSSHLLVSLHRMYLDFDAGQTERWVEAAEGAMGLCLLTRGDDPVYLPNGSALCAWEVVELFELEPFILHADAFGKGVEKNLKRAAKGVKQYASSVRPQHDLRRGGEVSAEGSG